MLLSGNSEFFFAVITRFSLRTILKSGIRNATMLRSRETGSHDAIGDWLAGSALPPVPGAADIHLPATDSTMDHIPPSCHAVLPRRSPLAKTDGRCCPIGIRQLAIGN
jgi:hypothetical protein